MFPKGEVGYNCINAVSCSETDANFEVQTWINNNRHNWDYYKIEECPIEILLDPNFIDGFYKKGNFTCLSISNRLETQVIIGSNGDLHILTTRPIYVELGLQGKQFEYCHGFSGYDIEFNVFNQDYRRQYYKIYKRKIQVLPNVNILIQWEPHDPAVCPSSIAKYLSDCGLGVKQCPLEINVCSKMTTEHIPTTSLENTEEILEYIGLKLLDFEFPTQTYNNRDLNGVKNMQINVLKICGLLTHTLVTELIKHLRKNFTDHQWSGITLNTLKHIPNTHQLKSSRKFFMEDRSMTILKIGENETIKFQ